MLSKDEIMNILFEKSFGEENFICDWNDFTNVGQM